MKVKVDRDKVRRYAIAMLLQAGYVLAMAGVALIVAMVAELVTQ